MDAVDALLAIGAGLLAGIINTLAGSGSLVTLPLLVFLGLPAPVANGTNRIGVLVQSVAGAAEFRRGGAELPPGVLRPIAAAVAGSLVGAAIAVDLDQTLLERSIAVLMAVMLVVVLVRPNRWLRERPENLTERPGLVAVLGFFVIGVYGGFIQAGVGVVLLAAMVLGLGYDLVTANYVKLVVVLVYTIPAIGVFVANDQVDWGLGALLALGQAVGAWAAARFATSNARANLWVRRLLVAVIVIGILQFAGVLG